MQKCLESLEQLLEWGVLAPVLLGSTQMKREKKGQQGKQTSKMYKAQYDHLQVNNPKHLIIPWDKELSIFRLKSKV